MALIYIPLLCTTWTIEENLSKKRPFLREVPVWPKYFLLPFKGPLLSIRHPAVPGWTRSISLSSCRRTGLLITATETCVVYGDTGTPGLSHYPTATRSGCSGVMPAIPFLLSDWIFMIQRLPGWGH